MNQYEMPVEPSVGVDLLWYFAMTILTTGQRHRVRCHENQSRKLVGWKKKFACAFSLSMTTGVCRGPIPLRSISTDCCHKAPSHPPSAAAGLNFSAAALAATLLLW